MNRRLLFALKLLVMLSVLGLVAYKLSKAWNDVAAAKLSVNWAYAGLSVVAFSGTMITSGLVWRWLAYRMGDRHATLPLLGAYTFSQMGKYIPGKVMLLLMRVERTSRIGMESQVCVVATLIENAMYLVSGGVLAVVTVIVYLRDKPLYAAVLSAALVLILVAFHPRIFYTLLSKALVKMKRPAMTKEQQLGMPDLLIAVVLFMPCWVFGGLSLWCAAHALVVVSPSQILPLPGAYALGVTGGMVSLLPGGLGPNDGIKSLFLEPMIGAKAALLAVGVQRIAQMLVEAILGISGGILTSFPSKMKKGGEAAVAGEAGPLAAQP